MKTSLFKACGFFTRFLNKTKENKTSEREEEPYVLFKVLPAPGEEGEISTGGALRQALYKTKPLKSLATALDYMEEAGICFLKDTAPQNIFLILGEHPEALYQSLFSLPIAPERFKNPRTAPFSGLPQQSVDKDMEYRAVIFCKLKGTSKIHEFFDFPGREQENGNWIYVLNWIDFFNLKEKQDNPAPINSPAE